MTVPKDPQKAEAYKNLLSQKAKGRVFTDEHRDKLSKAKLKNPVKYWQGKQRREQEHQKYLKRKEKKIASVVQWRKDNKDRAWLYINNQKVRRQEDFEKIAGRPKPEYCEVCGSNGRICFDHCHNTGKFRGWICEQCNVLLGFAKDDIVRLQSLISYLQKFHAERLNEETSISQ